MAFQDQTLTCVDCGKQFVWTASEQEFYAQKGYENAPKRCPECRERRKSEKMSMRTNRPKYPAVCAQCGKNCEVPFPPKPGGKPVLCDDCWRQSRQQQVQ